MRSSILPLALIATSPVTGARADDAPFTIEVVRDQVRQLVLAGARTLQKSLQMLGEDLVTVGAFLALGGSMVWGQVPGVSSLATRRASWRSFRV